MSGGGRTNASARRTAGTAASENTGKVSVSRLEHPRRQRPGRCPCEQTVRLTFTLLRLLFVLSPTAINRTVSWLPKVDRTVSKAFLIGLRKRSVSLLNVSNRGTVVTRALFTQLASSVDNYARSTEKVPYVFFFVALSWFCG